MIVINTIDEQIINSTQFKINPCLEFACAIKAVGKREPLFDLARQMNFNIHKDDEKLLDELEKPMSKYIRSEMNYFFSICDIEVIISAFTVDYENIDTVPKFLDVMQKESTTVLFKYLGGIFIAAELPTLNAEWGEINSDISKMQAYIENSKMEDLSAKEKLLECFGNPEETKQRLLFLFKQFYERSYRPIEQTVLEKIQNIQEQYKSMLKSNAQDFINKYFFNFFKIENGTWEYKLNIHLSLFQYIYFWTINLHDYKQKPGWMVLGIRTYEFYFQKEAADRVDRFLKVLSDKRRVDIVKMLSNKPYYGYEIAAKLELTPATVNYHINLLMDAGIITFDREENKIYFSINKEKVKDLLRETSIMLINEPL